MSNEESAVPAVEQPSPDDWRERLIPEFDDLQGKIDRLSAFLDLVESGAKDVDPVTKALLVAQHGAMTAYLGILSIRINARVQQQAV